MQVILDISAKIQRQDLHYDIIITEHSCFVLFLTMFTITC